ncbi:MAG TPA: DUF2303 family protein [Kofleriaceae bacterium]|nr:DUF2303 family protein [Kofleriaceae bacterium]
MTTAREGMDVNTRITEWGHPDAADDDSGPAVPVVLVTEVDNDGNAATRVTLAGDILAELDRRMPGPRRREGRVQLQDVQSFCEYLSRYQRPESSVVYANVSAMTFEAVIDEHPLGLPNDEIATAWRGHRAIYACPRSPEWLAWTAKDGAAMKQDEFADFLETRLEDMVTGEGFPKPVEVLAVARQLHIRTKGTFQREINPTNGDNILVHKTETETGSTQIPRAFAVAIPVFEGGERYQVEARVRFSIGDRGPVFSYTLHRRSEIERDAFGGVRKMIAGTTKLPVLSGIPG